jgi:hypothetical protein
VITTPDLIESLAKQLIPVRRLRPPLLRALCWLAVAALVLGLVVVGQGPRPDLVQRLHRTGFVLGLAAALTTGASASVAAFMLSLPDRSRLCLLLPAPALVSWLSALGYQSLTDWVSLNPGGPSLAEIAQCVATLVLTGLPLSLVLLVMLWRAAPLRPAETAVAGGLAVAGLSTAALSLVDAIDATLMVLVWNLGTMVLLIVLGCLCGRRLLCWAMPQLPRRQG